MLLTVLGEVEKYFKWEKKIVKRGGGQVPSSNNKTLNARLLPRHKFVTGATLLQLAGTQRGSYPRVPVIAT